MNIKVYFDESGNSGDNLLDRDQPYFVLASHNYNEDECKAILGPLLPNDGGEVHFKKLVKYPKNYDKIIEVLNNEMIDATRVESALAHKEFALWCNIVDKTVEPMYPKLFNEDMDKGGRKLQLANLLYYHQDKIEKDLIEELLQTFQSYYREKESAKQQELEDELLVILGRIQMTTEDSDAREFFGYIYMGYIYEAWDKPGEKYHLDFTLSELNYLCNRWGEKLGQSFDIHHDNSKQIEHWRDYIALMADPRIPETIVGYGDRKHTYPLKIKSLELMDSKNSIGIQLADVFASVLSYAARKRDEDPENGFVKKLFNTKFFQLPCVMQIGPGLNLDHEKHSKEMEEDGIDGVDFIVEQMEKYLKK